MKELPRIKLPIVEIEVKENSDKLDKVLENWFSDASDRECIREYIFHESNKPYAIAELLEEYQKLEYNVMSTENMYKVCMIIRDLKKLNSPITPNGLHPQLLEFKFSRFYKEWSVFDIEREYLEIHLLRDKTPNISPKDKYYKKEVLEMLDLLLDCDVIYNFKRNDLFVNSIEGELESYFRNYKRIRVQTL